MILWGKKLYTPPINSFDHLVDLNARVQSWLGDNRAMVAGAYTDAGVAGQLRSSTDLRLNDISHQETIEALEAIVSDEIKMLNRIVEETRAWGRKEKVAS